jgi:hypothetical protein
VRAARLWTQASTRAVPASLRSRNVSGPPSGTEVEARVVGKRDTPRRDIAAPWWQQAAGEAEFAGVVPLRASVREGTFEVEDE